MEKKLLYKTLFILALAALAAFYAFPLNKRINLGLDLQGGMHLLLKVDASKLQGKAKEDAAERALEVIRNRIDQFGVRESSIQRQGEDEVVVQLPGVTERERAIELIGRTAQLEFKFAVFDDEKIKQALQGNVPEGLELSYSQEDGRPMLLEKQAVLTGEVVKDAMVNFNQSSLNEPVVGLKFSPEGAKKFAELTAKNVGRNLAIVLDGKIQSAPRIKEVIPSGEAVITGSFKVEEAQDLALVLRVGALPAPMYIEEERTIGPLLGQDSIKQGILATAIGGLLVLLFMAGYYFLAGLIADFALLLNLLFILGSLGILPLLFPGVSATLTLPGIAGMVLSLGMAVDANVLINERIREELKLGRTIKTAITNGYNRAFTAIWDSNITTLIAAILLFQFGTGPIRGFAVTLTIGLMASLFTAVVVTRTVFEILLAKGMLKSLPMLSLIKEPKLDYISKRRFFYAVSLIIICTGIFLYNKKGKEVYGIDFVGGQLQEYNFKTPPDMEKVRAIMKELGAGDAAIQLSKDKANQGKNVLLIRTLEDKSTQITARLMKDFPGQDVQMLRIERVGPVAGAHLKSKALSALIWSLIGILVYVSIRFKHFNFAIAGVIALFHDVLIAAAFMVFTGRQIDLLSVTAFLTIAGYSINDTIVIYDRVRENGRLFPKKNLTELINLSVNQCMSRTLLTSGVTLLTVLAIMVYGGEVLGNFAFTLFVGFISGVYSTVYIASPMVIAFSGKKQKAA